MILESRLTERNDTPPSYQAGPEWTSTECEDLADFVSAAADNDIHLELVPDAELPTIYDLRPGSVIYRWEDEDGSWLYTAAWETHSSDSIS